MVWLKQFFVTTAFKQNFFLASFRADVYSTVLSLVPGQAWQAQESYGWCFLMTRAAIILWSGVIEYELNGMVSSSLMLIYILVYSKYLVLFLCEHYICGGPYVHWVELGENKAPSWGSGRNKDGAHVDTVVQYFLWSLHLDCKRAHPLPPLKLLYLQAFFLSRRAHLPSISAKSAVIPVSKTRVQGIIEGNRAIYKLLTDCFNGYDSCKVVNIPPSLTCASCMCDTTGTDMFYKSQMSGK